MQKGFFLATVFIVIAQPVVPALAQVDDIVVTARKRDESIIKVPVIESVLTQKALDQYATNNLSSVAVHIPSFVIANTNGSLGAQVNIRGIGASAVNPMIDQSVSLNIDGLQLSQGLAYAAGMFDVGQVEVLKGPQALFFGKSSPAGVISLRSADPTDKTEVVLRGGYEFEAKERIGELVLSGPVTSSLKLRFAGRFSDMDGFFRNDANAVPGRGGATPAFRNFAPDRNWLLRGTALFNPSSSYNARLKLNFSHEAINGSGGDLQVTYCPAGTTSTIGIPFTNPEENCKLDRQLRIAWFDPAVFTGIPNGGVPFANTRQIFGTLEQDIHFDPNLTLTSVSAYYKMESASLFNGSSTSGIPAIGSNNVFSNRQLTQELRLASAFSGPLNFTVGGFYQDGALQNHLKIFGNPTIRLPLNLQDVRHVVDIHSLSGFGQVTWDITNTIELAAGARWTHETRTHAETNFAPASGALGLVPLLEPRISSSNLSPEFTVRYSPNNDLTFFGSLKKGYKSGSFNAASFVPATAGAAFGDERVFGGEVGLKSRLLDRHLSVNVGGYYFTYKGLQVGATQRQANGTITVLTLNAASANVYGIDMDATYQPAAIEGLTFRAAANWNRARYGSFVNAPCGQAQSIAQGCDQQFVANKLDPTTGLFGLYTAQDLSGQALVRAPQWTMNGGLDYERPISKDVDLSLGTDVYHSTWYWNNPTNLEGLVQKGFYKVGANITLSDSAKRWEVSFIGNNLGNTITANNCSAVNVKNGILGGQVAGGPSSGPAGPDGATCNADRGRELWIRLTYRLF